MAASRPIALAAALLLAACASGPPPDPVEALLQELALAVEQRDVAAVAERLAAEFQGEGRIGKSEVLVTLRRYLAGYDSIAIELYDVRREGDTRVSFRADFAGKPRDAGGLAGLLPESATYEFALELTGQGDDLKVFVASWRPWTPPPSR